jgi:hypothetical protein
MEKARLETPTINKKVHCANEPFRVCLGHLRRSVAAYSLGAFMPVLETCSGTLQVHCLVT